jgi:hypothetical protein
VLLPSTALGSGWSSEPSAADPATITFTAKCGIADELLEQASETASARLEKGVIILQAVYRLEDANAAAATIADLVTTCSDQPSDENETVRATGVSFALAGVPPTDAYRLNTRYESSLMTMNTEAAWAVTVLGPTTLGVLGVNSNDVLGELEDPFSYLDQAVEAAYGG